MSSAKQPDPDLRAKGWQQEQEQEGGTVIEEV